MEVLHEIFSVRQRKFESVIEKSSGVLHMGAHLGQERTFYNRLNKHVLWIEAIPSIFNRLKENLLSFPDQRALCALLSNESRKEYIFYISNNNGGVSSSIYEFGEYGEGAKSLWPRLNLSMIEEISLVSITVDELLAQHEIKAGDFDCWVIDLQGAELLALQGAEKSLHHCNSLMVEVSTVEVYQGGVLWPELSGWLNEEGFTQCWEPCIDHDNVLFLRK